MQESHLKALEADTQISEYDHEDGVMAFEAIGTHGMLVRVTAGDGQVYYSNMMPESMAYKVLHRMAIRHLIAEDLKAEKPCPDYQLYMAELLDQLDKHIHRFTIYNS